MALRLVSCLFHTEHLAKFAETQMEQYGTIRLTRVITQCARIYYYIGP